MPLSRKTAAGACVFAAALLSAGPADADDQAAASGSTDASVWDALAAGSTKLNLRYRFEFVDQEGIGDNARANTVLARLQWQSASYQGFHLGLGVDHVQALGEERFNSTTNGESEFPVVADPEGTDLNLAFLAYKTERATFTGGRQRINHADQRFIGGVAWRQNEQTFDAMRAQLAPTDGLKIDYSYVWNVNRIFGPGDGAQPGNWRSNSHLLDVQWTPLAGHKITGFAHLLDFSNDNGLPNSTRTFGASYSGSFDKLDLTATIATQRDHADSPLDYQAEYFSLQASYPVGAVALKAEYTVLGSDDGVAAFRTPLATLHKFQGWADKFLLTPATGIEDLRIGVAGKTGKLAYGAFWHQFRANEGSIDYGDEVNFVGTYTFSKRVSGQFKFARFWTPS